MSGRDTSSVVSHSTATLTVRIPAETLDVTYPRQLGSAAQMRQALRTYLAQQAVDAADVYPVVLAADEAFVNALTHGGDGVIGVSACVSDGEASVEVRNRGDRFALRRRRRGTVPDLRRRHGRGVFLIRSLMDSVSVETGCGGTTVRMVKRLRETSVQAS